MPLRKATVERAGKLTEWYLKTAGARRKDTIEAFRDVNRKAQSYDSLKELMLQLSYASIPMSKGREVKLGKVPKNHRRRVREFKKLLKDGSLDVEKTRKACWQFLRHSLKERLSYLAPVENKEIEAMQNRFEQSLNKAASILIESMNAHPARAYSMVWRSLGEKIHHEIPLVIEKSSSEEEKLQRLKTLWHANYLKADAQVQYNKSNSYLIEMVKKNQLKGISNETLIKQQEFYLGRVVSQDLKKAVGNWEKSIRRYYRPGARKPTLPREPREKLLESFRGFDTDAKLRPSGRLNAPYLKNLVLFSRHRNAATTIYRDAVKKMNELGIKELQK